MKETLKQRIADMMERMTARIQQLEKHIQEYKQENKFEEAMKCDIKKRTLQMVLTDLRNQLYKS